MTVLDCLQPDGFLLSCTLHCFAASLVWLSASLQRTSRPQAAAAAKAAAKGGPDPPSLQPLLAKLLQIPGVSTPEVLPTTYLPSLVVQTSLSAQPEILNPKS